MAAVDKTYAEARSRIIWGESSDAVKDYLIDQNVPAGEVRRMMEVLLNERYAIVRKKGKRKLVKAVLAMILCGVLLYAFNHVFELESVSSYWFTRIRRYDVVIYLVPLLGIAWSIWKGIDGLVEIISPSRFRGNVGAD